MNNNVLQNFDNRLIREYKEGKCIIREYENGDMVSRCDGKLHRENGHATVMLGHKEWCLEGKHYSEKDWIKEMRRRKLEALNL